MKYAVLLIGALALITCPVHAQSLTIPLTFTNDAATMVVTVGFHPDASDAFDIGLDALAPPPPPAQLFDVRSVIDNTEYIQDMRDTTSAETVFHISLAHSEGSPTFTMQWDAASLAGLGTFEITDDMDGSLFGPLDMTSVNTLDLLSSSTLIENGLRIRVVLGEDNNSVSIDEEREVADQFTLQQNFPNPFNQQTDIAFRISQADHVTLVVYDLLGKEKEVLIDEFKAPGSYTLTWNAQAEASGVYYYSLSVGSQVTTRSMILTR